MRQVAFKGLPQLGQIIERYRRVHVMLHMVVHVPIEEIHDRTAEIGSGALPPIRHIRPHPRVLRKMREYDEPPGQKRSKRDQ